MLPSLCRRALGHLLIRSRTMKTCGSIHASRVLCLDSTLFCRTFPKWACFSTAPHTHPTSGTNMSVESVMHRFSRSRELHHFSPIDSLLSALRNTDVTDRAENCEAILKTFRSVSSGRAATLEHVEEIWRLVNEAGGEPDSAALLQCLQLYTAARLPPPAPLAELAAARRDPDLTGQLVRCLCAVGRVAAAAPHLESLRADGRPLSESLVHAVIVGHGVNGDVDAARDTAQALLPADSQDGTELELALMQAHIAARRPGPLAALLSRRFQERGELRLDQCLRLVEALLQTDQLDQLQQVLPLVPWSWYSDRTAACVRLQRHLVRVGRPQVALHLLGTALSRGAAEQDLVQLARGLLREMCATGQPVSAVSEVCAALSEGPLLPRAWMVAAEALYRLGQAAPALELLLRAHQAGQTLREHLFWPALRHQANSGDVEGVRATLGQMVAAGVPPGLETLREHALPVYLAVPQRPPSQLIVQQLKDSGLTVSAVIDALVGRLMVSGLYQEAADVCERYCESASVSALVGTVSYALQRDAELAACVRVLRCAFERRSRLQDPVGAVLLELSQRKPHLLHGLVEALGSSGLRVSPLAADLVCGRLGRTVSAPLQDAILALADGAVSSQPWENVESGTASLQNMDIDELEDHLVELTKKGGNTRGILRKLILNHCRKHNLERALALEQELTRLSDSGEGEPLTAGCLKALMELHVHHSQLEEALRYRQRLDQHWPEDKTLDQHKLINLATLLLRHHRTAEAVSLVNQLSPVSDPSRLWMNCWRLMAAAAGSGDTALTHNLLHLLVKRGVASHTVHLLGQVIRSHTTSDDLTGAVDEFVHCVKTHQVAPYAQGLLLEVIRVADEGRRQQLLDTTLQQLAQLHGEEGSQYQLALALSESGHTAQARAIFKALGPEVHFLDKSWSLKRHCHRKVRAGQTDALIQLLQTLTHRQARSAVYWALLNAYEATGDCEGVQTITTSLEGSHYPPRLVEHARRLADRLQAR